LNHPNNGANWPDTLDTDFILERALPYLGRFISMYKDLNDTHIKDCYKFESFLDNEFCNNHLKGIEKETGRKVIN
jgi:homospermidine synthase